METAPQNGKKEGARIRLFAALAGMVVTFLLGIFVGLHPRWIPIETSSAPDYGSPAKMPVVTTEGTQAGPTTVPDTQPASRGT
jgi:hypothetical protein